MEAAAAEKAEVEQARLAAEAAEAVQAPADKKPGPAGTTRGQNIDYFLKRVLLQMQATTDTKPGPAGTRPPSVERVWHTHDSQGQIPALALR